MIVMVYVLNRLFYRWSSSRKVNFKSINMQMINIPPLILAGSSEDEVVAMTGLGTSSTVIKMQTSDFLI